MYSILMKNFFDALLAMYYFAGLLKVMIVFFFKFNDKERITVLSEVTVIVTVTVFLNLTIMKELLCCQKLLLLFPFSGLD